MTIEEKRQFESRILYQILVIYCKGKHRVVRKRLEPPSGQDMAADLCDECQELYAYAEARVAHCPHMERKTFCSVCPTHCYQKDYRVRIREVMKYVGSRMLLHAPILVLKHMYYEWREKRLLKHNRAA